MINFIVITHGEFGAYLVEAAESIVGKQEEGVSVVSISERHGVDEVRTQFKAALDKLTNGDGVVVAADMPGGTPMNVALPFIRDRAKVEMVSGLNLYMMVTGFANRRDMRVAEVAAKMRENAKRSVQDLKELFSLGTQHH